MNPVQILGDQIRDLLPRRARRIIYSLWTLVGALLAAWEYFDVGALGPVSVDEALKVYLAVSPLVAGLAAANSAEPREAEIVDYGEDLEAVGSFDPVDDPDAVYA